MSYLESRMRPVGISSQAVGAAKRLRDRPYEK